jgi:hypothetical protein
MKLRQLLEALPTGLIEAGFTLAEAGDQFPRLPARGCVHWHAGHPGRRR